MKTPKTLGRYEIISEISRGAMGRVYLAHDPEIDRRVAIKTIHPMQGLSDEEAEETRRRFSREAQAAGKLQHPGIVTIFDVGVQEGIAFIAMEYIEGDTLEAYTSTAHLLPASGVVSLIIQACEALDYAHRQRVVHRDIKPANLMLVKNGRLKITDFGLAKNPANNLTQDGALLGTPNYMSPEQIMGKAVDGRSDLFSLAAALYEMLTGVRPFDGDSITTIIYRIINEDPRQLEQIAARIPAPLMQVLTRGLAKKPEDRYQSGAEFAAALRGAVATIQASRAAAQPKTTGPPSQGPGPQAASPRRRPRPPQKEAPARQPQKGPAVQVGRSAPAVTAPADAKRFAVSRPVAQVSAGARLRHHTFTFAMMFSILLLAPAQPTRDDHWGRGDADGMPPFYKAALAMAGPIDNGVPDTPAPPAVPQITVPGAERMVEVTMRTDPPGGTIYMDEQKLSDGVIHLPEGDESQHTVVAENDCFIDKINYRLDQAKTKTIRLKTPKVALLTVGSTPLGAGIFLDGKATSQVTPAELPVTMCDAHSVKLKLDGYRVLTRKITDPGVPVSFKLTKIPEGYVQVDSSYPVTVYEAGKQLGTSGDRIKLIEGKHKIRLINEDLFVDKTVSVEIRAKSTAKPGAQLPGVGRLTVLASPSNCTIFVNDREIGAPPINDYPLAEGTYKVRAIYLPTGEAKEASVTVHEGAGARVPFRFSP